MSNSWDELSAVTAGLILNGKISKASVRPEIFIPPYDQLIKNYQNGAHSNEDLIEAVGFMPIQAAQEAAKSLNGLGEESDWPMLLERSAERYRIGQGLEQAARKLKHGEEISLNQVESAIEAINHAGESQLKPITQVKTEPAWFIPSGWLAIDNHLGGWPKKGLVTIAAATKVGKTSFLIKAAGKFLKKYPDKRVAIFSVEMSESEFKGRVKNICKLNKAEAERLLVCDRVDMSVHQMVSEAARVENLGMMGVDFADLLIAGEVTSGSMEDIYRVLVKGAKTLGVPVFLLAQLSGSYQGGVPRPYHVRWTRLAEALSWMMIMLYNPTADHYPRFDEELLPIVPNYAYVVCWLIRGGFRKRTGPGAIQLPFRGDKSWHNGPGEWFILRKD